MKFRAIVAALLLFPPVVIVLDADPKPREDRVGFPAGYETKFQSIRVANKTAKTLLGTIYANEKAASVGALGQLPYPNGSVIVMEWAQPLKSESDALLLDANGLWRKGDVVRVDVMRRESGYGEGYGAEHRSGEWEFASYRPDGTPIPLDAGVSCAACHRGATAERDFVFQGRFPPLQKND